MLYMYVLSGLGQLVRHTYIYNVDTGPDWPNSDKYDPYHWPSASLVLCNNKEQEMQMASDM